MQKINKIAISLPNEIFKAVEQERRRSGESRSELFRRAIKMLLNQRREQRMRDRYVQAYRQMPETGEEVEAARRAASAILTEESWK